MPKRFVHRMAAAAVLAAVGGAAAAQSPTPRPVAPMPTPVGCVPAGLPTSTPSPITPVPLQTSVVYAPPPIPVVPAPRCAPPPTIFLPGPLSTQSCDPCRLTPSPSLLSVSAAETFPGVPAWAKQVYIILDELSAPWAKFTADLPGIGLKPDEIMTIAATRAATLVWEARSNESSGAADVLTRPQKMLTENQTGIFRVVQGCSARPGAGGQPAPVPAETVPSATPRVDSFVFGIRMTLEGLDGIFLVPDCPAQPGAGGQPTTLENQHALPSPPPVKSDGDRATTLPNAPPVEPAPAVLDGGTVVCECPVTKATEARAAAPAPVGTPPTRTFAVGGLVAPFRVETAEAPPLGKFYPAGGAPGADQPVHTVGFTTPAAPEAAAADAAANARALCTLVTNIVRPYTWAANGGTGTVAFDPKTLSLVVSNTDAVQAEVAGLVAALQRLQDKGCGCQVAFEFRVLEVPVPAVERLGVDFAPPHAAACGGTEPPAAGAAFLTDAQTRTLLTYALEDRGANVFMAPKMTCMDGQRGTIQVCRTETFLTGLELSAAPGGVTRRPKYESVDVGLRLAAKPTVSADRRFVRVELRYEEARLRPPAAPPVPVVTGDGGPADVLALPGVDRHAAALTLALPDGGTAVVPGPVVVRGVRHEDGPPVVSQIPYMNRFFKTVGVARVPVRQLLLVTPRVIRAEDQDRPVAGCPACPGGPRELTAVAAKRTCGGPCDGPGAAELVAAYRKACAEGRPEAATALAVRALALDPACFAGGCEAK